MSILQHYLNKGFVSQVSESSSLISISSGALVWGPIKCVEFLWCILPICFFIVINENHSIEVKQMNSYKFTWLILNLQTINRQLWVHRNLVNVYKIFHLDFEEVFMSHLSNKNPNRYFHINWHICHYISYKL